MLHLFRSLRKLDPNMEPGSSKSTAPLPPSGWWPPPGPTWRGENGSFDLEEWVLLGKMRQNVLEFSGVLKNSVSFIMGIFVQLEFDSSLSRFAMRSGAAHWRTNQPGWCITHQPRLDFTCNKPDFFTKFTIEIYTDLYWIWSSASNIGFHQAQRLDLASHHIHNMGHGSKPKSSC